MVWKLSSLNSDDSGNYVFVSPGTYRIGRKDCAVCIPADKTISRLHAELVVHQLPPETQQTQQQSPQTKCNATLTDLSKFGTFVNKASTTSSQAVMKLPNKQTTIYHGDEITFGTMSSTFRATYVHFFFCVSASHSDALIAKAQNDLGAYSVKVWNPECTHLLVEDGSSVNELVFMAVSHRKPIVSLHWLEAVTAASSPVSDIPSTSSFVPTLKLSPEATLVKVTDPETRQTTFKSVVFLATSLHRYSCKENLRSLVRAAGATLELVSNFKDSRMHQIVIVPDAADEADVRREFKGFHQIQRIKESSLLVAILSGCKERSAFFTASSDSESTGATVDLQEDTEDEADSAAQPESNKPTFKPADDSPTRALALEPPSNEAVSCKATPEDQKLELEKNTPKFTSSSRVEPRASASKASLEKNEVEYGEVSFVLGLVVRSEQQQTSPVVRRSTTDGPNFKRFQRVGAVAGNSFQTFVPFAAVPYGETAYFGELKERIDQEKKRNEEEKLADELFKRDDLKRKRTAKGESLALLKESSSKRRK